MGLDLIISEQSDFGIDEFGRYTYKVTQLFQIRDCYAILNQLEYILEDTLSIGGSYIFFGQSFHRVLEELQTQLTELPNKNFYSEYKEYKTKELEYSIEKLEEFIATNEISNDYTQTYEVSIL